MVPVVSLVGEYVRGAAQTAVDAADAARRTGMTDDQWWAAYEPVFDRYFDASRYPTLEVEQSSAFAPSDYTLQRALDSFEFGLPRVLDGIEAFVGERSVRPDQPPGGRGVRGCREQVVR